MISYSILNAMPCHSQWKDRRRSFIVIFTQYTKYLAVDWTSILQSNLVQCNNSLQADIIITLTLRWWLFHSCKGHSPKEHTLGNTLLLSNSLKYYFIKKGFFSFHSISFGRASSFWFNVECGLTSSSTMKYKIFGHFKGNPLLH
jgi:hypothetical protein